MPRFTTITLVASALSLATGSVAVGEQQQVEFNYTWYGYAPNAPAVDSWSMSHLSVVDWEPDGRFHVPGGTLNLDLIVGGEVNPITISVLTGGFLEGGFSMTMDLVDVPGYGPMNIEISGGGKFFQDGAVWSGEVEITWGPGNPLAGTVTQQGEWFAQVVPAPSAIALLGLAGLSARRRRD
ncbi:MAG: hypothetical protein ACYTE2_07065 [Planctomycetota bacterium]|jgi:hypothetical protein